MIQDKNISNLEISNRTLSNSRIMDIELYLNTTGIENASKKVSDAYAAVGLSKDGMPSLDAILDPSFDVAAHLDAMDTVASEAGLQADIASSQAAADIQDAINAAGGEISEDLAQANAEAQQALADAQRALDESRADPNRDRSGEVAVLVEELVNLNITFFIVLLSTFYPVKLSGLKISGHSSVVERLVANEKVEGSSPFARSNKRLIWKIYQKKMHTM